MDLYLKPGRITRPSSVPGYTNYGCGGNTGENKFSVNMTHQATTLSNGIFVSRKTGRRVFDAIPGA